MQKSLTSGSPNQTRDIAIALSPILHAGDVLLLQGPIGAGKSHFARSLILALLPEPEDIPSPTYTLVQTYDVPLAEIWHADLYRLADVGEMHELGLFTAFEDAICLVEWPERLGKNVPSSALRIEFLPGENDSSRVLRFTWTDGTWDDRLKDVYDDNAFSG